MSDEARLHLLEETTIDSARPYEFIWNQRRCHGTLLHKAVCEGEIQEVSQLLDSGAASVHDRFHYETSFNGQKQAGSGEAIHLAAASGDVGMVSLLLQRRASLDAKVTRGTQDHYDVLHSAIYGHGRGGSAELVTLLLQKKAPFSVNANKYTALHVAFLTGRPDLIKIVRHGALDRDNADMGEDKEDQEIYTPLELGIANGKMDVEQLSALAPMTPVSLRVFTRSGPDCIVPFLERCLREGIRASGLAHRISFKDLTSVLRENPAAAGALLERLASRPQEENPAWHPLPTRVSFAPVTMVEKIRYWHVLNPPPALLTFYEPHNKWKYDNANFQPPDWHNLLIAHRLARERARTGAQSTRGWRRQLVRDVDVRVCHVPNLACAEVFAALGLSKSREELKIFTTPVVKGLISHVWLQGACRVDLMQALLSLYCLLIMIVEQVLTLPAPGDDFDARRLRHTGVAHDISDPDLEQQSMDFGVAGWDPIPVSMNLIGARGVVQLLLEILTLVAYLRICPENWLLSLGEYMSVGSAFSILQAMLQIGMVWEPSNITLRVSVIFLCWGSLLRTCTPFEKIACELLPIMHCAGGLIPSAVLTLVFFLASFHALFNLKRAQSMGALSELFLDTFSMLFTGALPADVGTDVLVMTFTYTAVLIFSVFFLNIFIGVIIEQYGIWKGQVQYTYQQVVCHHCLNYLLQARYLPTQLMSRAVAKATFVIAASLVVGLQVVGLARGQLVPGSRPLFVVCLIVIILSFFQDREAPWLKQCSPDDKGEPKRYLWIVVPKEPKPETPPDLLDLHEDVRELLRRTAPGGATSEMSRQTSPAFPSETQSPSRGLQPKRSRTQALTEVDRQSWMSDLRSEAPSLLR